MARTWETLEKSAAARTSTLAEIDELIPQLNERMDTMQGLMREHLTALRGYLLGGMPQEYQSTVDMAREILPEIEPAELKNRLGEILNS